MERVRSRGGAQQFHIDKVIGFLEVKIIGD